MAMQSEINRDLFGKYNTVLKEQAATNGYLKSIVEQNDKALLPSTKAIYQALIDRIDGE